MATSGGAALRWGKGVGNLGRYTGNILIIWVISKVFIIC